MRCPKCGSKFMRQAHDGRCCFLCGCLVLDDVNVLVALPVKERVPRISLGRQLAVKYFDSILRQRESLVGWYTICKLLSKAEGRVVQEKTVKKWWAVELELRNESKKEKQKIAA